MSVLYERPDALVGSLLGKVYRVLEPIGMGGMAVVYLVEHQTLLKRFAAKVLSNDLASSLEARARFMQEAHAASQLDHENIVSISDFGATVDQRPFFVMELLRGQTLDQRLTEGPMTIEEVVAVCVPVARALAHAHAEGIVHLDVKPENIFLVQRTQGRWGVKVVDFGIAKTPLNPRMTKLGETAGSPMFMAPEVCRGDDDVDQRADVYSFGILLYLMLCGRLPFVDESTHRVLQMQLVELPPPPREVNSRLSPELAMIVERALAKNRDDRYPSMEALLYDLAAALPPGADRLLIEAQSGTPLNETPFSGALSIARPESQPALRQAPIISPLAPRRGHAPLVIVTAMIVTALIGVLAWRQMDTPTAAARGRERHASAKLPANPTTPPAPRDPAARSTDDELVRPTAPPGPAPAAPANDPPESDHNVAAPTTADREPAAAELGKPAVAAPEPIAPPRVEHPKVERQIAIAKKPVVRPKLVPRPVVRPAPQRPGKRPIVVASAGTPPAPPATPPGPEPPVPQAVEADAASDAPAPAPTAPPDPGVTAPPVVAPVTVPAKPAPVKPAPVKPAPVAPVSAGALDAVPAVMMLEVKGSLSPSIVRRSVERSLPSLRECYRAAARAAKATPALELRLTFEIDENSLATQVATSGANFGSLATCAAGVAGQIRTQEAPDVGTAQVTAVIRFRPS